MTIQKSLSLLSLSVVMAACGGEEPGEQPPVPMTGAFELTGTWASNYGADKKISKDK